MELSYRVFETPSIDSVRTVIQLQYGYSWRSAPAIDASPSFLPHLAEDAKCVAQARPPRPVASPKVSTLPSTNDDSALAARQARQQTRCSSIRHPSQWTTVPGANAARSTRSVQT